MQQDAVRYEAWLEQLLYESDEESLVSIAKWKPTRTEIPYVEGGFGDGSYPVFQLIASGKIIGLEVEFIKGSDKYPS
jgi:hypothetical protein